MNSTKASSQQEKMKTFRAHLEAILALPNEADLGALIKPLSSGMKKELLCTVLAKIDNTKSAPMAAAKLVAVLEKQQEPIGEWINSRSNVLSFSALTAELIQALLPHLPQQIKGNLFRALSNSRNLELMQLMDIKELPEKDLAAGFANTFFTDNPKMRLWLMSQTDVTPGVIFLHQYALQEQDSPFTSQGEKFKRLANQSAECLTPAQITYLAQRKKNRLNLPDGFTLKDLLKTHANKSELEKETSRLSHASLPKTIKKM